MKRRTRRPTEPDLFEAPKKRKASKGLVRVPVAPALRWMTFDPASLADPVNVKTKPPCMGVSWWEGDGVLACAALWHDRAASRWTLKTWFPVQGEPAHVRHFASDWLAIRSCLRAIGGDEADTFRPGAVFYERAIGMNPRVVSDQAETRGYIRGLAHEAGCEHVMQIATPQTWKRAAGQHCGSPYPSKSAPGKTHSVELARTLGFALGDSDDDAADAVMQGVAVPYLGIMPDVLPDEAEAAVALANRLF